MGDAPASLLRGGELNAAVAQAVSRIHSQYTGRGPTRSRAFHRDAVVVALLEDVWTTAERTVIARGELAAVLALRRRFQRAMRDDLVAAIERLTRRRVVAFFSDSHADPDLAVEVFVLDRALGRG